VRPRETAKEAIGGAGRLNQVGQTGEAQGSRRGQEGSR